MNDFWSTTWRSPYRASLAGVLLSAIIASVLYGFNWHTFYDTRTNFANLRAEQVAQDIETLALATGAAPGNDADFRKALSQYIEPRRQLITVSRSVESGDRSGEWMESNKVVVDEGRRPVKTEFELSAGKDSTERSALHVTFEVGVRPPFRVALFRAWTLSALDYLESPKIWWDNFLYNRSKPLYGYFFTILLVGFGTIRAFYRDQHELLRLEQEGLEITRELEGLITNHSEEIAEYRQNISNSETQRDSAIESRDELLGEMRAIEQEYQELISSSESMAEDDPRLHEAKAKKNQVEGALASYNMKVAYYEHELQATRSELDAAEQLLHEVEDRREDMGRKLQARNREIRKMQTAIQYTQKEMRKMQSEQLRMGQAHLRDLRGWEENQRLIEEQLSQWLKTSGHVQVNFSQHSKAEWVEEQFRKIDQAFVDRYFTHVNNSEYERGGNRLIRVHTDEGKGGSASSGTLLVALDDDGGRSLSMRFETVKDAPKPQYIGFVLALLLKGNCRDFQHFPIRLR